MTDKERINQIERENHETDKHWAWKSMHERAEAAEKIIIDKDAEIDGLHVLLESMQARGKQMAKKQDAYECYNCKTRHSTDNMEAYCAVCYHAVEASCQMFQSQAKKAGDRVDEVEAEDQLARKSAEKQGLRDTPERATIARLVKSLESRMMELDLTYATLSKAQDRIIELQSMDTKDAQENDALRSQLAAKSAECERLREALDFWSDPLDRSGLLALVKEHRCSESCASMTVEQSFDAREAALAPRAEKPAGEVER